MRYDLTDFEWSVIEPLLPMDRRGPKPKNIRQIINGMFYVLRRRLAVARSSRTVRALHDGLQPFQSLAQSRHLGPPDGRHCEGPRRQGAGHRQFHRARTSACLRCEKKSGVRCVGQAEAASPRRSTRASTRRAARSAS